MSDIEIKRVVDGLIGLKNEDFNEFYNDIVCVFDFTDEEIIVSSPNEMNTFNGKDGVHSVYENRVGSTEIQFEIKDGEIVDAWQK